MAETFCVDPGPGAASGSKVLIIEDDRFISEMYSRILRDAGYVATVAHDGRAGLDQIKEGDYDLVLLDIMLPRMLGDEVLHQWREFKPKSERPRIIVMTNFEQDEISRAALEAEVDAYLIKADITPCKLREVVAKVLEN